MKTEWRINLATSILVILLAEFGRRTLYLCSTFINIYLSYAGILSRTTNISFQRVANK